MLKNKKLLLLEQFILNVKRMENAFDGLNIKCLKNYIDKDTDIEYLIKEYVSVQCEAHTGYIRNGLIKKYKLTEDELSRILDSLMGLLSFILNIDVLKNKEKYEEFWR